MAWIYKLRVWLISTTAVILIILAVAFTALRTFLPHATEYVSEIQQALSHQIGLPVSIDSIDADMSWFTPRLKLINVVIHDEDNKKEFLRFDEAVFALAYIDSLFNLSPVVGEINLIGTDLYIERHPENRWVIQGIELAAGDSNTSSGELVKLIQNTNFSLLDSDVHWKDYTRKHKAVQMDFIGVNLIFESFLGTHSLAVDMQLPEGYGDSLWFIAKIDDDLDKYETADWEIYIEGHTVNIERLMSELELDNAPDIRGTLDGKIWLSLDDKKLSRATGDLSVNNLKLANADFKQRKWDADYVSTRLDWKKLKEGWRLDVNELTLVKNKDAWAELTDVTAINHNESGLHATATYLRPFDLIGLPGVFLTGKNLSEMEKINSMYLGGDLYNVEIDFPEHAEEEPELTATFLDVDLRLADTGIDLQGADGVLKYRKGHVGLDFLSESVTIDFGDMFRQPIYAERLTGEIVANHVDYNWVIESSDIHLLNEDIEAHSRIKAVLDKDGEVFVDLQTDFLNARGESAHKYYPLPVMSDDLVEWLDKGITDGVVEKGSFILFGDVEKFPYAEKDGVMEVVFGGKDLTLHFYDGWPDIQELNADVRFYNSSLEIVNGTGRTYDGVIKQATATIPDLNAPTLFVEGNITAPADNLQKYIWNSGLDDILGAGMRQYLTSGETGLKLSLEIPLDDEDAGDIKVKGELDLSNNETYFPAMDYLLYGITGKLSFTENAIWGSDIVAIFDGAPVKINAYGEGDKLNYERVFHITGNLPIDGLLKRFDWVPDHWVSGSSDWDVAINIPNKVDKYSVRVEMQSALEGVSIDLSDVLSKQRYDVMHMELVVDVLDGGIHLDMNSDDVVNLFATRDDEANWDFVVDSKLIRGSGEFAEDLNKDSTALLNLEHMSLHKLFYSSDTPDDLRPLNPVMFPSLKFTAKNLAWEDMAFKNVNFETSWHPHGMLIDELSLEGPSLEVNGRGSWLSTWRKKNETNFKFFVNSSNLGDTLSTLGFSDSLSRCDQIATVDWQWEAEPYRFSLGAVKGSAHFELSNGEVTNLQPGAGGRLLGLFNVFKLGDRLTLDFDDVYKEGFSFDSVKGDFEFDEGDVYTEEISVKAAAADMKIDGRIGIVERDYDLNMHVKPHSSAAAFTGGALVGGIITGAAAVLLNKVLGLEKMSRDEYVVTGSWDDPVVTQIAKRKREDEEREQTNEQDDENHDDH
jgi:uncharacterized protein YhdP